MVALIHDRSTNSESVSSALTRSRSGSEDLREAARAALGAAQTGIGAAGEIAEGVTRRVADAFLDSRSTTPPGVIGGCWGDPNANSQLPSKREAGPVRSPASVNPIDVGAKMLLRQQIQELGPDGDSIDIKVGSGLGMEVAMPGVAEAKAKFTGAVAAHVTRSQDPVTGDPQFHVTVSGEVALSAGGEGRAYGAIKGEGEVGARGSAGATYTFSSAEEASQFLIDLKNDRTALARNSDKLESFELNGGAGAELAAGLGLNEYLEAKVGAGVDGSAGIRIEREPPAVVVTTQGELDLKARVALGIAIERQGACSGTLETRIPLKEGVSFGEILSGKISAEDAFDVKGMSGTLSVTFSHEVSGGVGPMKIGGLSSEHTISRELNSAELISAASQAGSLNPSGCAAVILDPDAKITYRKESVLVLGPSGDFSLSGGLGGVGATQEWTIEGSRTNRSTTYHRGGCLKDVLEHVKN